MVEFISFSEEIPPKVACESHHASRPLRAMLTPPLDIIARDLPHDGVELRTGGRGEHVGDVIVGVDVVT